MDIGVGVGMFAMVLAIFVVEIWSIVGFLGVLITTWFRKTLLSNSWLLFCRFSALAQEFIPQVFSLFWGKSGVVVA